MNDEQFHKIVQKQLEKCAITLNIKAEEYSLDVDRLHNFRMAATLQGITMHEALAGFMVKHTISLYDMLAEKDSTSFSPEQWDEKITDHMNYLAILQAVLEAERPMVFDGLATIPGAIFVEGSLQHTLINTNENTRNPE